jgi:thiol-disulfide isomerase/thioredoxin
MNRRQLVMGGVAVAAAAGGAGWAVWRQERAAADAALDSAATALWAMRFEQPAGGELSLAAARGRPILINFWATWCPPCIKEMPLLDSFHREQAAKGWQVVGLAVDGPTPVREFLRKRPVGFAIGLAGMEGIELARSLGNAGGQLPYTVLIDRAGRLSQRMLGTVTPELLARWVHEMG